MSTVPVRLAHLQMSTLTMNRGILLNLNSTPTLQQGYQAALTAQQANAPALTVKVTGPGVYAGTDGKKYFVPSARLAYRVNLPLTPDISFTSDGKSWKIQLLIELIRPPGADNSAIAFLMSNYRLDIVSGSQTPGFSFPTVTALSAPAGATDVIGILKAEGTIDEAVATTLLSKEPAAHLNLVGTLSYRFSFTHMVNTPPNRPAPPVVHPGGGLHPTPQVHILQKVEAPEAGIPVADDPEPAPAVSHGPIVVNREINTTLHVNPNPPPHSETVIQGITADQVISSTIKAYFPSDLVDFQPIYASIMGSTSDGTVWSQQTGQGYTKPSSGSSAFYLLPDSFRMAVDANSGLPAMSLLLLQTPPATPGGSTSFSLRVRIAIAPLLDGARLELMRESFRTSHNIPYAQFAIGGYSSATFVPSALFAELPGFQSGVSGDGKSSAVDAANGFELVLDCSLEFYTLLTKLLCSVDGLQGSVQFQIVTSHIASTPPVETTLMVSVPVILSFLGPSPLKLPVQVSTAADATTDSSISISITNPLKVPLAVTGIYPTLMINDPDLGITTGATLLKASKDPLALAASEQQVITVSKSDGSALSTYTALATDLGSTTPTFDPQAVLNHYQEIVESAGINATVHFNCYLLKHVDQIPPSLTNLVGMQVEVQHGNGVVMGVPLTRDTPSMDVAIPYSFAELLAGVSLTEPTIQYRAKSVFTDHAGTFSDWIPNTGGNVEVTPT